MVMTVSAPNFVNQSQCGIRVFSPSDIVATASSQVFRIDSVAKTAVALGSAFLSQNGGLWAANMSDLFVTSGASAQHWTGGPTWTNLTTGLNGSLAALSGTASSRMFAAGAAFFPGMTFGTVLFWDGLGWTVEAIPAMTPRLQGIWAAPQPGGQVFAVGISGTIITGP